MYLDTSAAMKIAIEEPESEALLEYLESVDDTLLVSSWLLHTELHRALGRRLTDISEETVRQVLDAVELVDLTRRDMISAARFVPLRSHDAIHLTVALRLQVDAIVSYDLEMLAAARRVGLAPVSPGVDGVGEAPG